MKYTIKLVKYIKRHELRYAFSGNFFHKSSSNFSKVKHDIYHLFNDEKSLDETLPVDIIQQTSTI